MCPSVANRRFEVTLQYLRSFVIEWFDQNPLGQIGIILLRNRLAQTLVLMCGELRMMVLTANVRQPAGNH